MGSYPKLKFSSRFNIFSFSTYMDAECFNFFLKKRWAVCVEEMVETELIFSSCVGVALD